MLCSYTSGSFLYEETAGSVLYRSPSGESKSYNQSYMYPETFVPDQ